VSDGGEDGQTCEQGDDGVEQADHSGGLDEVDLTAGIGAVGDHGAHTERQGEERLTHSRQDRLGVEGGEVGLEIELQTRGHALAQRQGVAGNADNDDEEDGHKDLGHLFDTVLNAAEDDVHGQGHEDRGEEDDFAHVGGEAGDDARVAAEGVQGILGRPAAEHAVVANDECGDGDGDKTEPTDVLIDVLVRGDGVCCGALTDVDLAEHRHEADEQHAGDVDENEGGAAVLRGFVREAPDVTKTHRTAGSGEDKADAAGKANFFLFHLYFLLFLFRV